MISNSVRINFLVWGLYFEQKHNAIGIMATAHIKYTNSSMHYQILAMQISNESSLNGDLGEYREFQKRC